MTGFYQAYAEACRPSRVIGLLVLLMLAIPALAQPQEDVAPEGESILARLPIEIINNRVHATFTVNGTPVKMLLDTGATTSILFKNPGIAASELATSPTVDINFPAFRTATKGIRLAGVRYDAGDFSFESTSTLYIANRDAISTDLSFQIEGILGRDFFGAYIVEIIPSMSQMVIIRNGTKLGDRFRYRHQLYMDGGSPYLLHRSRLPWEEHPSVKKLLLDTGYPGGIVLWNDRHFSRATTPGEREELKAENKGVIYYGVIKFGRLIFRNIPIFIGSSAPERTDDRDGIIGASMFLPFRYAIDLERKSLWLNPRVRSFDDRYQISNDVIFTPGNEDFVVKEFPPRLTATPTLILRKDTEVVPD